VVKTLNLGRDGASAHWHSGAQLFTMSRDASRDSG
jgi:hypothetical protein